MRKSGDPASSQDRSLWSNDKLIHNLKRCIRSDYGGKSKMKVTMSRIKRELGEEAIYISDAILERLSEIVIKLNEQNISGIQKRVSHTIVEIEKRL